MFKAVNAYAQISRFVHQSTLSLTHTHTPCLSLFLSQTHFYFFTFEKCSQSFLFSSIFICAGVGSEDDAGGGVGNIQLIRIGEI